MWPFNPAPKPEDVDAAVSAAKKDMEPDALDHLSHLEPGSRVFGYLVYLGGGSFIDFSEIASVSVHKELAFVQMRGGERISLSNLGANRIAQYIESQTKGHSTL